MTSVVLPGSMVTSDGGFGRSFERSTCGTARASLPAASTGISNRPSALVLAWPSPMLLGLEVSSGRVMAMTSRSRTAFESSAVTRPIRRPAAFKTWLPCSISPEPASLQAERSGVDVNHLDIVCSAALDLAITV